MRFQASLPALFLFSSLFETQIYPISFEYLDSSEIKTSAENRMIGISAIRYDDKTGDLYALSDDSGYFKQYGTKSKARFYKLHLQASGEGFQVDLPQDGTVFFQRQNEQKNMFFWSTGMYFSDGSIDPEGMAFLENGNVLVSSEQDISSWNIYPKFYEFDRSGALVKEYSFPDRFNNTGLSNTKGCRRNKCIEGIDVLPDQKVVTITEKPLVQDEKSKLLRFSIFQKGENMELTEEYAYEMSPIENELVQGFEKISRGVSDLLVLEENRFIAIERTFVKYKDKRKPLSIVRLYEFFVTPENTNLVSNDTMPKHVVPLKKKLVLDLLQVKDKEQKAIDNLNIEGIAFGPTINGAKTLILSSDNGDNIENATKFLLFKIVD